MSASLAAVIREEIASRAPIPFRRFMELALYHPQLGYYASGRARIGRGGDFFTNVSVGPLFGRLLARQIAEMWQQLGEPEEFSVVEQGANSGDLAADILEGFACLAPACFAATSFVVVEPFPVLAERQRERLRAFGGKAKWVSGLAELALDAAVHVSNELIDAFPVDVVQWDGSDWRVKLVESRDGAFAFIDGPPVSGALARACAQIPGPLPRGFVTEVNLELESWIAAVSGTTRRGFVLAVDYGYPRAEYYSPGRVEGTLSAYSSHRREDDPLARPGEMDLTAHVDFDRLIESAERAGFRLEGFTDQHHFAVGLGVAHFADGANAGERRAFQTLMHPQMMGTAFKVIAFSKGLEERTPLAGFQLARVARRGGAS